MGISKMMKEAVDTARSANATPPTVGRVSGGGRVKGGSTPMGGARPSVRVEEGMESNEIRRPNATHTGYTE